MSRLVSPSITNVAARGPRPLFLEYLISRGLSSEVAPKIDAEDWVDAVSASIKRLSPSQFEQVTIEISELDAHADAGFCTSLIRTGLELKPPLHLETAFPCMKSPQERALWTLLNHHDLYHATLRFEETAGLDYHRCSLFGELTIPGGVELADLRRKLSEWSVTHGRGKGIDVKEYWIGDCRLFVCLVEDAGRRDPNFDGRGRLGYLYRRPAYEVVYRLELEKRLLRSYVRGGATVRREVELIFGRAMLGIELPARDDSARYALCRFLDPGGCKLDVSSEPAVERVSVDQLSVLCSDNAMDKITLDFREEASDDDIDARVQSLVAKHTFGAAALVPRVRLRAYFRPKQGRKLRAISVTVTPTTFTYRDDPRYDLIQRLLREWKIDVLNTTSGDTEPTPRAAQRVIPNL